MHKVLTMTGIDGRTDPKWIKSALQRLVRKSGYCAVEFGILRSPKVDQSPRYPGREVIKKLLTGGYPGDFAFHLCGRYAQMVHDHEWAELCDIIDFSAVGRVQVNSKECDEKAMLTLMRFSVHIGRPVIMQWRGEVFPAVPSLHLLQDNSGGRGITETKWIAPDGICRKSNTKIGYAGGLGPDNVGSALPELVGIAGSKGFWIDCESSLRTDDWFDQSKAEAMIDAVYTAMPDMFHERTHSVVAS